MLSKKMEYFVDLDINADAYLSIIVTKQNFE